MGQSPVAQATEEAFARCVVCEYPLRGIERTSFASAIRDSHPGQQGSREILALPLSLIPTGDGRLRPALGRS